MLLAVVLGIIAFSILFCNLPANDLYCNAYSAMYNFSEAKKIFKLFLLKILFNTAKNNKEPTCTYCITMFMNGKRAEPKLG